MLRTPRNSSLTLGVEKRVAHAPPGERSVWSFDLDLFRIGDFGFLVRGLAVESICMKIVIGSTREPKVKAVKEAWKVFGPKLLDDLDEKTTFPSYDVSNGVPKMPLKVAELMDGARNRAENLMLQLKRESLRPIIMSDLRRASM